MSRSFGICPVCGEDVFDDIPCSNGCEDNLIQEENMKNYKKADGIWLITEQNKEKIADIDTKGDIGLLGQLIHDNKDDIARFLSLYDARAIAISLTPLGDGFSYNFGTNHDFINKLFEFASLPKEDRQEYLQQMEEEIAPSLEEIRKGKWVDRKSRMNKITKKHILLQIKRLKDQQEELENLLDDPSKFVLR